jgi:hypothetical protein
MNQRSLNVEVVTTLQEITNNIARLARLADRLTVNIEHIGRRIERRIAHLEGIEGVTFRPRC